MYVIYPCIDKAYYKQAAWNTFGNFQNIRGLPLKKLLGWIVKRKLNQVCVG